MEITSGTVSHDNVDISVALAVVVIANDEFVPHGGQDLDLERDLLHFFRGECFRVDLFENKVVLQYDADRSAFSTPDAFSRPRYAIP